MACGISSERPSFDFSVFVPMKDWGFCSKARGTWILVHAREPCNLFQLLKSVTLVLSTINLSVEIATLASTATLEVTKTGH